MYTFSSKLKTFSFALMIIGALCVGYGFLSAPSTLEESIAMTAHDSHDAHAADAHVVDAHGAEAHAVDAHGADDAHAMHVFHQLQNRPWSALYVAIFFFLLIALATLAFYAIQHATQAGWSIVLFRVMEAIAAYLPIGGILLFVFLMLSGAHMNHLFVWMDPEVVKGDILLENKAGYLNIPFFLLRAAIYITGWSFFQWHSRKLTLAQDKVDTGNYRKLFKRSAGFLVFFLITESMMSWDWIMSLDPHWFSTLFGWYIFSSGIVSAVTMIALVTMYLKSQGYLDIVNDSHLHDLAKYMFGFSVFWTYLWFSQFMLIWYANIPEEVTYFITRFEDYRLPFLGMVGLNFFFPVLVLINSDFKRVNWFVMVTGIVILIGHYIDIYVMIMPATVGKQWFIGIPEIGGVMLIAGIFIYVVFNALSKAPLIVKNNPYIKESEGFHY